MPTKPLESVLYRELSILSTRDFIEVASPLLQELVNYGTNALVRCATSRSGGVDEDLAVLTLYRQVIEATDGAEVLVSSACAGATVPLLRTSFEALLSMDYILEDPSSYARRSLSWLVGYVRQRLDMLERLDPSTTKGMFTLYGRNQ